MHPQYAAKCSQYQNAKILSPTPEEQPWLMPSGDSLTFSSLNNEDYIL